MKSMATTVLCLVWAVSMMQASSRPAESAQKESRDIGLELRIIPLRDSVSSTNSDDIPTLTVFAPQSGRANGTAVVVAPGGAYLGLAENLEGRQVADWFATRGVTAFLLKYRLGPKNVYPIPLQDAQRAIRLVRASAQQFSIRPDKIGMIGFSAGGHLTAMTGTSFDEGTRDSPDPIERVSDRPDFLILGYPWLNAMLPNDKGLITYCSAIKTLSLERCRQFEGQYTPARHVSKNTPPTFIYMTADDEGVPSQSSVDFYEALRAAGVDAELHMFRHGSHGSGLGSGSPALGLWPILLEQWLRDQGDLTPPGSSH